MHLKSYALMLLLFFGGTGGYGLSAQSAQDLRLLEQMVSQKSYVGESFHHPKRFQWTLNPFALTARGLFHIYQRHLTQQLSTACPYHPSCSEFSRQCFKLYDPLKAFSLTTDRLTRCTRLHFTADKVNLQFKDQRWIDRPEYYRLHWHPNYSEQ